MTAGLQRENLIIVAARPGVGKTSWAVNVAMNAALHHKIPVLIFSLEMSKYELMERMLAGEARIDSRPDEARLHRIQRLEEPDLPGGQPARRGADPDRRLGGALDPGDPRQGPPLPQRSALLPPRGRRATTEKPLGLIVVDYLQLARGSTGKKDETREREIADISRGLKALAKDLKVPIIAISQLNRGLEKREDKRPQLSDLRESGAIEQDADMILFIHREEMFNTESAERGKAELIVGKHRHGPTGSVPLTFIRSTPGSRTTPRSLKNPGDTDVVASEGSWKSKALPSRRVTWSGATGCCAPSAWAPWARSSWGSTTAWAAGRP